MPFLKVQTNHSVDEQRRASLLAKASETVSKVLGKQERYVMVALEDGAPMLFAGSDAPLAYLELKSIGLPETRTADQSLALCELIHAELGIARDRIYIEFADAPRNMWGWNGATF